MVKAYVENGEFKFMGTFDFGYIGLYKDDMISIEEDCSDIRDEWYEELSEVMDIDNATDEEIAAYLEDLMNKTEKKIQENIDYINSEFLYNIYHDMEGCGNEFWEREELRVAGFDYDDPDFDFYSYSVVPSGTVFRDYGHRKPNDGSCKKDSFVQYLRENKPMFNLDNFIKGIEPEYLTLHPSYISFQCSDKYDWALICGAYDKVDLNDLSFWDWHNY